MVTASVVTSRPASGAAAISWGSECQSWADRPPPPLDAPPEWALVSRMY